MKSPFQLLLELFRSRFFENDAVSPDGGFETNVWQVLGFLATPGFFVSLFLMPDYMDLGMQKPGPSIDWAVRSHRLFFIAYSFAVTGFVTVFEWDTLFPDRRDFMVLASFPIRLRDLFAAKFAALGLFLVAMAGAVNLFSTLMMPGLSMRIPQVRGAGAMHLIAAQVAATGGAAVFAFLAVAAFQGVLINVTSPRVFRRISPSIQMFGMSVMIISLLLFPIYSMMMRATAATHPGWLWFFPPFWFCGVYDLMLPRPDPVFASLGWFAVKALGIGVAAFAVGWGAGFRRYYRRTLETEDTASRRPSAIRPERLVGLPEERAIFAFTGWTLARSTRHRLFLATYFSVGLSIGLLATISVRAGRVAISPDGLRSLPFLVVFFVISGLRAAFQFPAELGANWLFRITESAWGETSRRATRKQVLLSGLIPCLVLVMPLEIWGWGLRAGWLHIVFQFVSGALLVEVLFWTFGKVPFTCSYFPGRTNLALLVVVYLYGFTSYSFRMADLEKGVERDWGLGVLFFGVGAVALMMLWLRAPAASGVRFEAGEPEIQMLDLS